MCIVCILFFLHIQKFRCKRLAPLLFSFHFSDLDARQKTHSHDFKHIICIKYVKSLFLKSEAMLKILTGFIF